MTRDEAATYHNKHSSNKFPVFLWREGLYFVTEIDGRGIRASTYWQMDNKLDGIAPRPRDFYLVDKPEHKN